MKQLKNVYKLFNKLNLLIRNIFIFLIKGFIKIYQITLSPILKLLFGNGCKYNPTCSEYSVVVIQKYGIIKGGLLSFKRILSCNSFFKSK